jgi:DNA polymerase V
MKYAIPGNVSVHDGFPNPATDLALQSLDLNQLLIRNPISTFFMRVAGNGGEAQGIFSGDILVVDRAPKPRRTHLVIYSQGDSLMVCRFAHVAPGAEVWGVVTTVIHKFH